MSGIYDYKAEYVLQNKRKTYEKRLFSMSVKDGVSRLSGNIKEVLFLSISLYIFKPGLLKAHIHPGNAVFISLIPSLQNRRLLRSKNGKKIEVEIFDIPVSNLGKFMLNVKSPLAIGDVVLEDGKTVKGFVAESIYIENAKDITEIGSFK